MAFCTECGSRLPDDAVFCPNCGTSLKPKQKAEDVGSAEVAAEQTQEDIKAPELERAAEETVTAGTYQSYGAYEAPAQGSYSAPAQGAYTPPVQGSYTPHAQEAYSYQGQYAPPQQPQYNQANAYGYPPQGGVGLAVKPAKKLSAGAIVAIVLGGIVLLAIAAVIIISVFSAPSSPYVGYWETTAVDTGDGTITEDYYGTSIVGALGVQINSDNSAYLASVANPDVIDGTWEETDDGLAITTDDYTYSFTYDDKQLVMTEQGENYYFSKLKDRDINNPTVPHGSLAGSDSAGNYEGSDAVAGSGDIGSGIFHISVIGAEDFLDVDGDPAIRIYYDFTNNYQDDFSVKAHENLSYTAVQDGSALTETYSSDDSAADNLSYNIRPGVTIQCCSEFKYNPGGGSVDFNVCDYYEGESGGVVTASYVPGSLPGAPAPYVIVPVTDPQWTMNIPAEGDLDDYYVAVGDAEMVNDISGDPAIRIYYEFTNNSDSPASLGSELYVYTYQDGISLQTAYMDEESDSDSYFYNNIAPGQTISCSFVYSLRNSNSPVEAEVEAYSSLTAVGQTYNIAD